MPGEANVNMGPRNPVHGSAVMVAATDPIDEKEGLPRLLLFGLQHVLVMYAGTVAVPLILGSALHFTPRQVIALISADLFTLAWQRFCKPWVGGSLGRAFR
jgi:hypothetical protein